MAAPLVYAHRGAPVERPENTWPSFARALELGADALETDVHLSADGHVVISHDPDGLRMAGVAKAIAGTTLAELRKWDLGHGFSRPTAISPAEFGMITLADLLDRTSVPINVDLKAPDPRLAAAFIQVVRQARAADRVTAASFVRANLVALRQLGWKGALSLAPSEVAAWLVTPSFVWRRLGPRAQHVQPPLRQGRLRLDTAWVIGHAHRSGLVIDYWTVNDAEEARKLCRLGTDGIMTDDPATIVPVVREMRR